MPDKGADAVTRIEDRRLKDELDARTRRSWQFVLQAPFEEEEHELRCGILGCPEPPGWLSSSGSAGRGSALVSRLMPTSQLADGFRATGHQLRRCYLRPERG